MRSHTCDVKTKRVISINVSKSDNKNILKCDLCGKNFGRRANLNKHRDNVHFKVKKFACSQCDKRFAQKCDLKKHIASVHEKLQFPCDICEKVFSRKCHLTTHKEIVHDKKYPFSCKLCGKGTARKSYLDAHMRYHHPKEHEEEKAEYVSANPAECLKCKKRFHDSVQLQRHINHVHRMESGIQ